MQNSEGSTGTASRGQWSTRFHCSWKNPDYAAIDRKNNADSARNGKLMNEELQRPENVQARRRGGSTGIDRIQLF